MRFAFTRPDGGASIVIGAPGASREAVLATIPADATDIAELPDNWTPPDTDRQFRNAWKHTNGVFSVDMPKARDVVRERMRYVRKDLLAALDVQYQKADEAGDNQKKKDIAAQKQKLRDITAVPELDAAATPDALRQVWPAELGPK